MKIVVKNQDEPIKIVETKHSLMTDAAREYVKSEMILIRHIDRGLYMITQDDQRFLEEANFLFPPVHEGDIGFYVIGTAVFVRAEPRKERSSPFFTSDVTEEDVNILKSILSLKGQKKIAKDFRGMY